MLREISLLKKRIEDLERSERDRKDVEDALRKSEARFKRLAENSPGVVYQFMMTPDGTFSFPYINEEVLSVMGVSPRDVMRDASLLIGRIHPDDIDAFRQGVLESARSLTRYQSAFRCLKGGRYVWVEVRSMPERLPDGSVLWDGFFFDVTERKEEQESLRKTQFTMDRAPDSILWVDDEGRIVYANDRASEWTGFTGEELLKMSIFELDPDFLLENWESHKEEMKRLKVMSFEGRHMTKDERTFPVEVSTNYFEVDGRFMVCAFDRDISVRKEEQKALLESEAKFRDLAEKSVAGVYLIQDGIIKYANAKVSEILGYSIDEMTGRMRLKDVIHPEDWPVVEANMIRRLAGEAVPQHYEFRLLTKHGEARTVEVYSSRTIYQGRPAAIGTLLDITERKEAERRIVESERSLSAILAASPIGIGMARDRKIAWVNERVCMFTGYTQEELQGRSTSVFYESPEEYERVGEILYREEQARTKMVRADGEVRDVLIQLCFTDPESCIFTVVDITEQQRTEEHLRFAQFAMDRARDPIVWVRDDGCIFYANDSACKSLGYSREELLKMTVFDVDPTYPREAWVPAWTRLRRDGSLLIEARPRRKDGSVFSLEVSASFLSYGDMEYACAFMRDVTERKLMEDSLRMSEERFHALFESAGDAIVIARDAIIDCNGKTLEMFGCSRNEIVGKTLVAFSPECQATGGRSVEEASAKTRACLQGTPQFFEWKYLRTDGTPFDAEVSLTRIDIRGETYLQAIIRDITRRKRTEEDLRRLSIAIEQAAEEIIITDAEGTIQYVNPAFEAISGYSRQDAIGQTPRLVKSGVHDKAFYEDLWNTIKGGNIWTGQITNRRKDGALIHEDAIISPLMNSSGGLTGYISLKRDITEEVKLHSQLRQAQKMESVGTLAGGIAHDFNNILTALIGYATIVQMKMEKDSPLMPYIDQVLSASQKAADLTRSLLTFSRQQPITLAPLDLNDAIRATEKLLKRLLTEDIDLHTSLAGERTVVMADRSQIDQILFNLVSNARDAMPKGGLLAIGTDVVDMDRRFIGTFGFGEPGRYVLISVSDTGVGMDAATREKIFEPFFTTKELGRGTGLGLATVYGIVKQHNGYITVDSQPNQGTAFHIYLPAVDLTANNKEHEAPAVKGGDELILIAEDNGEVRRFMCDVLKRYGYRIVEAVDGDEAVRSFRDHTGIDLVILDSVMPKRNGREAYEEIRGVDPHVRVLFTSGYTRDIILDKGVEEGKFDFIAKPLLIGKLLAKVREILDR
jgi:PAS domain S-box-containing protein